MIDCAVLALQVGDDVVDFANKMNAGEASFADVPNIDKIGEMLQMCLVDYNVASPLDADYSSMITSFATGKAAMYHNGSWSTGDVLGMNPDMNLSDTAARSRACWTATSANNLTRRNHV